MCVPTRTRLCSGGRDTQCPLTDERAQKAGLQICRGSGGSAALRVASKPVSARRAVTGGEGGGEVSDEILFGLEADGEAYESVLAERRSERGCRTLWVRLVGDEGFVVTYRDCGGDDAQVVDEGQALLVGASDDEGDHATEPPS